MAYPNNLEELRAVLLSRPLPIGLDALLAKLTYREREVLKLRYGIGDGYVYTRDEVGRIFKVTRERVRQVEDKALRKAMKLIDTLPVRVVPLEWVAM